MNRRNVIKAGSAGAIFAALQPLLGMVGPADGLAWVNRGIMSGSMDMRCLVVS